MATGTDNTVVIDNGSYTCKAGFAGNDRPTVVFPTVLGRQRHHGGQLAGLNGLKLVKDVYVGEEAVSKRVLLDLDYPVQNGTITNWDSIEKVWEHIFDEELRIDQRGSSVLIADKPSQSTPDSSRTKMTEIMFEKFQVNAFYVALQATLSLYTTGKTTGAVLDVEDGVTQSFAVYERYVLPSSTRTLNLSGRDLTDNLMERLNQSGQSFSNNADREIVRDIKEKCCYVSEFVCKKNDTPINKPETEKVYNCLMGVN